MLVVLSSNYIGTNYGLIDEELSQVNINQMAYNPDWLSTMVLRGKINAVNRQQILQIVETLENTYPNLWDIQVSKTKWKYKIRYANISGYGAKEFEIERNFHTLYFDIIIKFPEVLIKDGQHTPHLIRDLYVKLQYHQIATNQKLVNEINTTQGYLDLHPEIMEHDGLYIPFNDFTIGHSIYGLRESVTEDEYRSRYNHSHLNTSFNMLWSQFCLGSGEIAQTLVLLEQRFSIDLFQMSLYQLESYVAWESRTGGPYYNYTRVKEISGEPLKKLPDLSISDIDYFITEIKDYWNRNVSNPPIFNWKITNNNPELILDQEVNKFLRIYTDKNMYLSGCVFYQDKEGNYYNIDSIPTPIDLNNLTKNTIVFKGEVKGFKIIELKEVAEISSDLVFHPKIKEILKQKLEAYGNNAKLRECISQRATEIIYSRRAAQQNQISMLQD